MTETVLGSEGMLDGSPALMYSGGCQTWHSLFGGGQAGARCWCAVYHYSKLPVPSQLPLSLKENMKVLLAQMKAEGAPWVWPSGYH